MILCFLTTIDRNSSGPCPELLRTGRGLRHSNAPRADTEKSLIRPQRQVPAGQNCFGLSRTVTIDQNSCFAASPVDAKGPGSGALSLFSPK